MTMKNNRKSISNVSGSVKVRDFFYNLNKFEYHIFDQRGNDAGLAKFNAMTVQEKVSAIIATEKTRGTKNIYFLHMTIDQAIEVCNSFKKDITIWSEAICSENETTKTAINYKAFLDRHKNGGNPNAADPKIFILDENSEIFKSDRKNVGVVEFSNVIGSIGDVIEFVEEADVLKAMTNIRIQQEKAEREAHEEAAAKTPCIITNPTFFRKEEVDAMIAEAVKGLVKEVEDLKKELTEKNSEVNRLNFLNSFFEVNIEKTKNENEKLKSEIAGMGQNENKVLENSGFVIYTDRGNKTARFLKDHVNKIFDNGKDYINDKVGSIFEQVEKTKIEVKEFTELLKEDTNHTKERGKDFIKKFGEDTKNNFSAVKNKVADFLIKYKLV